MMKALIVYFSQGGSTAKVAESIASGLRGSGYQVDLFNLKDGKPPAAKGYDLFGVGSPTYIYRPSFNILDYLQSLPELTGVPAFAFATSAGIVGHTGNNIRDALAKKGAKDAGYFKAHGACWFIGFLREGYLLKPGAPTKETLDQAESFGRAVVDNIAKSNYGKTPRDPQIKFLFRLQRLLLCRLFVQVMHSWLFFSKKSCDSCGVCVKTCPVGNIKAGKNGRPVWGHKDCLLCFYCELKCPKDAIMSAPHFMPVYRLFAKYVLGLEVAGRYYNRVVLKPGGRVESVSG
ncbi:MAG: EFR1 family ferrodoxin [Candidatus Omnitrophota bacterium]